MTHTGAVYDGFRWIDLQLLLRQVYEIFDIGWTHASVYDKLYTMFSWPLQVIESRTLAYTICSADKYRTWSKACRPLCRLIHPSWKPGNTLTSQTWLP
jgi:hypothetical protein